MRLRQPAAVLAALALTLPLAACGGQSVEDACTVAEKEVKSAMGDLDSLSATDPAAASKSIEKIGDALDRTEDKVDNDQVKTAVENLSDAFDQMEDAFEDLQEAGTDATKLKAVSTKVQDASTQVQKAGEKLDALCNDN